MSGRRDVECVGKGRVAKCKCIQGSEVVLGGESIRPGGGDGWIDGCNLAQALLALRWLRVPSTVEPHCTALGRKQLVRIWAAFLFCRRNTFLQAVIC